MERILFLAHAEPDGTLTKLALEALGATVSLAKASGGELAVGLTGQGASKACDAVGSCGASRFLVAPTPDDPPGSIDADAFEAVCRRADPTVVVVPGTSRVARSMPAVAIRIGGRIESKATSLGWEEGTVVVERWYYRQRMVGRLTRAHRPWVIAVEAGIAPAWSGSPSTVPTEAVEPVAVPSRTSVVGQEAASQGEQTIRPDAQLLFVAGAGWTKKQSDGQAHVAEAEALIKSFLDRTGASLGSSKSLVDQAGEGQVISLLTHMNQVGQTGSTPRHPKGLATCCHGEEPHVVGWRFISERRAINLDPNCGWAQGKADVVYVADAFAVVRKLNELLG